MGKKIAIAAGLTVLCLVGLWALVSRDREPSERSQLSVQEFERRIVEIDQDIVDLTWAGGLFKYPFFREVHEHPQSHVATVVEALGAERLTEQQKIIAALTMQRLPEKKFVDFGEQILRLLESGAISHEVFRWALFPTYEWNTTLAENHRSRRVKKLLTAILESPQVDDEVKALVRDEIQTGNARKQIRHLRDIGQLK